jgi:hypothetical protein
VKKMFEDAMIPNFLQYENCKFSNNFKSGRAFQPLSCLPLHADHLAHSVGKGHGVDPATGVNRQAGQEIGEQPLSVPTHAHAPEPDTTRQVDFDRGLGLGIGIGIGF